MTNKRSICFYSVLRFCPYRETDEFVNVGVILACPATGFLDFKFERADLDASPTFSLRAQYGDLSG